MGILTSTIRRSKGKPQLDSDSLLAQSIAATSSTTSIITRYSTLPIEYVEYNNVNTTISSNTLVGNSVADNNTLITKYNGNLTINSGYYLTPTTRKRGWVLIVNGNLTLNGKISMTARGAANVTGQRIYLATYNNITYEVPAIGGSGGVSISVSASSASGDKGKTLLGAPGGGGAGGNIGSSAGWTTSGAGGSATSFSGGAGGGAVGRFGTASSGSSIGGAGGNGFVSGDSNWSAGSGAGNPAGAVYGTSYPAVGTVGTGGLLIVYCTGTITISTSGSIESKGSKGGEILAGQGGWNNVGTFSGGGSSGGGAIYLFNSAISNSGTISVEGGASTYGLKNAYGGAAGDGYYANISI